MYLLRCKPKCGDSNQNIISGELYLATHEFGHSDSNDERYYFIINKVTEPGGYLQHRFEVLSKKESKLIKLIYDT